MYLIYSMLFSVGAILTAPFYWWRKGRAQKRAYWAERFGSLPFHESSPGAIWVHAVSLGETLAVAGLVKEMQQTFPERKIYLSNVTPAGREAGEKRLPSIAGRFFVPLDWRWAARKALARIKPSLLVIVETELWPNLLRAAQEAGARVVMVNARMSKRSLRRLSTRAALHTARTRQRGRHLRADGRRRRTIPPTRRQAGARHDGWKSEI